MTTAITITPSRGRAAAGPLLVMGIVLATLTEAIAGTVLSLGRSHIIGDTHATPDEFAWLDIGYAALKLIGFMVAPWLMNRVNPHRLVISATLIMGTACGIAATTYRLDLLVALRMIQGFSGAALLDIVPVNDVWVVANFKETQVEHIRPGQRARITVDGYPNERIEGVVDSFAPGSGSAFTMLPVDNATGNFIRVVQRVPVKIRFEDTARAHKLLRPGFSVVVTQ